MAEKKNIDIDEDEIQLLLRKKTDGMSDEEKRSFTEKFNKTVSKVSKRFNSSLVNQKFQEYVDNLKETKKELNEVFKNSKDIVAIIGKDRTPTKVKLVGYDSSTGDIFIEYKNNKNEVEHKMIKSKSVIIDIGKIPAPKQERKNKEKTTKPKTTKKPKK